MRGVNSIGRQPIELAPLWSEFFCSKSKGDHVEYHATSIGARGSGRSNAKATCGKCALNEDNREGAFNNNVEKRDSPTKLLPPIYS